MKILWIMKERLPQNGKKKGRVQVNTEENKDTREVHLKAIFILIFMQRSTEITLGE